MADLIDRQAAIDALDKYIKLNTAPTHYENQFWIEGMEDAERIIKELPSAQGCKYYDAESDFCALNRPAAQPEQLDTCPIYDGMCGYPSDRCYECPRHGGAKEKAMWWTLPSAQPERDIPLKPIETMDKAWGIPKRQAVCPKCDYYLGHIAFLGDYKGKRITYCETCGQAINWEGWDFDG